MEGSEVRRQEGRSVIGSLGEWWVDGFGGEKKIPSRGGDNYVRRWMDVFLIGFHRTADALRVFKG